VSANLPGKFRFLLVDGDGLVSLAGTRQDDKQVDSGRVRYKRGVKHPFPLDYFLFHFDRNDG
jgi:hypothetical protein